MRTNSSVPCETVHFQIIVGFLVTAPAGEFRILPLLEPKVCAPMPKLNTVDGGIESGIVLSGRQLSVVHSWQLVTHSLGYQLLDVHGLVVPGKVNAFVLLVRVVLERWDGEFLEIVGGRVLG